MIQSQNKDTPGAMALRRAETTLTRIQSYAEAVQMDTLTPGEAIEQILDELAARPALGRAPPSSEPQLQPFTAALSA